MKRVFSVLAMLASCVLGATLAEAQQPVQPSSVTASNFSRGYYYQPGERSPSDLPITEPAGGCDAGCGAAGCGTEGAACGCNANACDGCGCSSSCDSGCSSCGGCGCSCYLFGGDEPWKLFPANNCRRTEIGGWVSVGYHSNQTPQSVAFNDVLAFNDRARRVNLHQAWAYAERDADAGCCGWDWGYRVDFMYGTDAQKTQAFGNPPAAAGNPALTPTGWDNSWDHGGYGFALPQAYVELARGDWSVIAGKFFTLVGYEVVPAPGNFFYSHSYTMFNSEPFTHTGALATYSYSDALELYFGWTAGWDTGFTSNNSGSSWLGGMAWSIADDAKVTYISTAGNLGARGASGYTHSIVIDLQLTERLQYVCQSDWVNIQADAVNNGASNDQIGVNQYAFYSWNDCLKFGVRGEWWKSDGVSYYEVTGGINWFPIANLAIRPEVRYDFQPETRRLTTFGVDAYVTW